MASSATSIEGYLLANPNYRFVPLGPVSAAAVVTAVFFIMFFVWVYNLFRYRGFLTGSVIRLIAFCLIAIVGYILRIVCIETQPSIDADSATINNYVNLYIVSNTLTGIGNFFLFNALTATTYAWVTSSVRGVLSLNRASQNNNTIRIVGNLIFLVLLVVLIVVILFYSTQIHSSPSETAEPVAREQKGLFYLSYPYTVQIVLVINLAILTALQSFKLAQSLCPIDAPPLRNEALIYVFNPVLKLVILIVLAITWGPVFYAILYSRILVLRQRNTQQAANADIESASPAYPQSYPMQGHTNQPAYSQPAYGQPYGA
ncbi:hypothetical protein BZG36_04407 [Bifiguratus adelaidae]|uniref:Uncharacterized protein n=1 Tax=Bifiguratus adelaidae TaxID=1938954 RepID=A0A261XWB5_9FUNG|nr:hypothetical protein BZG36_04407 [Bifiguratus adelaidae]